MDKNKVVGFFGGTFDPLHFGHIQLALSILENGGLDAVFFCPTALSPSKISSRPHAKAQDRLEMVKRGIEGIKGFQLIEEEIHEQQPSFTIDTIRLLMTKYPQTTFRLILGQDHLVHFTSWKEWDELMHIAPPLVGARSTSSFTNPLQMEIIETSLFDISATHIRSRIKKGLYVGHLLPQATLEYIREKKLYD